MNRTELTDAEMDLWTTYLNDHATGATGALERLENMVEEYGDLPHHDDLQTLASQITDERERLLEIIKTLGAGRSGLKMAAAAVGEKVGRLKPNQHLTSRSPLSPLLEVELLRSGVLGKLSLWQTLTLHADRLGLDRSEFEELAAAAERQLETLATIHRTWAGQAFTAE
ncbi:hypothetical protein [Kytococcus sedentarius]|uniref:hypothetical protein n=1 Tax=Kytococcus sedentarius TaxID=1276 RepID=UPI0035BBCA31